VADIVIINPRFEVSYWGLEHALPLLGKRANLPVACLPLLAALTPEEHSVTLVDENVEELDFDRLAQADIVGVTGMSVQRHRMREILGELKQRGAFTVVGGPWVTVQEDYFEGLADAIFIGEAEQTWPQFLQEWAQGLHQPRYEQAEKSDMTATPTPRFDLLKMQHYMFGSLQFSRGCPFQCEFCDIIVTFGRRPRVKTSRQVIDELEALVAQKMPIVFIVDDNLIGNKKVIKEVLRDIIQWQHDNLYPLTFFTEASLDLAEDEELMDLMGQANIQSVFIGIESPNEESLRETKKHQNVREKAGSIVDRIHRIQQAGIEVWCGMILGFDNDDPGIFELQTRFLQEARIAHAMVGMLHAIPKTPLHARLEQEGRLDASDTPEFGTNVVPLNMSRAELREGYLRVMQELYEPEAYFGRLEDLYLDGGFVPRAYVMRAMKNHRRRELGIAAVNSLRAAYVFWQLMRRVPDASLRREYRRRMVRFVRRHRNPGLIFTWLLKCAMHFHHYTMVQRMARGQASLVNSF
jgi:radical SAM superfamily enzyme YgiQ (UPF0313 family)